MFALPNDLQIVRALECFALAAGREIEFIRAAGFTIETKKDQTPVTCADRRSEALIVDGLCRRFPDIPHVAEEETAAGVVCTLLEDVFFLVDALDGTKEFVTGRPDFTVNIALIRNRAPEIGVVCAPAHRLLYSGRPGYAEEVGLSPDLEIESRRQIAVRASGERHTIVASRAHCTPETDAFIARYPGSKRVSIGSSLKFCLLARGDADIYPRFSPTMEWDTAAGDAILRAAGGTTRMVGGGPLVYGKCDQPACPNFTNPYFVCEGKPAED